MAKYLKLLLVLVLAIYSLPTIAQYNFPEEKGEFLKLAEQMMNNTKKDRSVQVFNDFSVVWSGGTLTDQNQKTIISLCQDMAKKRLRASTNFTDFFASIAYGVSNQNMSASDIDSLLYVTELVLKNFDPKERNEYFSTIAGFLEHRHFYSSGYNTLLTSGGTFKFKYVEAVPEASPLDVYDQALNNQDNQSNSSWDDPNDHFDDWDNQDAVQDDWSGGWDDDSWGSDDGWGTDDGWSDESSNQSSDWDQNTSAANTASEESIFAVGYLPPVQPAIDGAVIEISDMDLTFITAHDSTSIKKTSGSLMLKNGVFVGEGGTFDWSSAGMSPEELYAELKEYNFEVRAPSFKAEPVELHYPEKSDSIVEGVFEFQSKKKFKPEDAQYPRFKSFASNVHLKGIGENIEYYGGLSLEGRKIYSSSVDEGRSKILIKRNGEVKVKAVANRFELSDSVINGNIAAIVIYQGKDSIYHPGTILQYTKNNTNLRLTKTSGYRHTPFIDTYHNMEITVDALIWNIETPEIKFSITNAANELPGKFESKEFFEGDRYSRLQGIYRFHPLQMIMGYAEGIRIKNQDSTYAPFFVSDLARIYKFEENTLNGAMVALMRGGFIDFKPKTGEVTLRDKAIHYVKARRDLKDYDNLSFESLEPGGNNATLNLDSKDLTVRGVDKVRIMDSLNIFILPESKSLVIKGNRGFQFDGKINTANFQFLGKNFEFNYDSFLVHMPEIDKIRLAAVDNKEEVGSKSKKARVLGNELRYSAGTLYLNKPDNKSGRLNFPEYPIFNANSGASVFFNKEEIAGGVYDTTIKFKIPPFTVDSLASNDPQSIGFEGEFESGGIFPPFKTKLVVMPDFSMGFEYPVPEEGFQLYEGKGKFFNTITMDNRGLIGNGRIEFLNTTCYSEQFYFFVDSVLTIGTNSDTKAGSNPSLSPEVSFPLLTVGQYEMNWKPKKDSMNITNLSSPFQLYQNTASLNGTAIITERGMLGSGVLETRGSVSASNKFHFEQSIFDGRNATFTVKSENPSKPAIRSTNCKLEFDLIKENATFGPEIAGYASTEFPFLKYKTSIEKGLWDLKAEKVQMKTEGDNLTNSYFYSTHPHQDSLAFNARAGIYDMKTLSLNIEGVPYINVIDGRIFPDSNKVVIHENAEMERLEFAKAEFDTINAYHRLFNGSFDIKGRYRLKGQATYSYTNASGDNYTFLFKNYSAVNKEDLKKSSKKKSKTKDGEEEKAEDIQALLVGNKDEDVSVEENPEKETEESGSDSSEDKQEKSDKKSKKDKKKKEGDSEENTTQEEEQTPLPLDAPVVLNNVSDDKKTVAVGLIYPEDSIEIAKKILYKGKVTMESDLKELVFDGFVKLDLKGALSYSQWLQYSNDGNNTNVKIILEDPKADNGNPLTTGLNINGDNDLYTTFISEKDSENDFNVFSSKGILKFSSHPDSSIFQVASENKLKNPETIPGNIFTYDDDSSTIEYSGRFNFIVENKGLNLKASGSGSAEVDSSFYKFNTMMVFDFEMHKSIPEAINENLKLVSDIIPPDSSEMIQDVNLLAAMEMRKNMKILELAGEKDYKNYITKSAGLPIPLYEISDVFKEGLVLSNVDMKWSNAHKAFYSVGKIKVGNFNETEIDRVMNGYVEIRKTLSGDLVSVLLEPTPNNWYYFTYDNNRVAVTTSSDEINSTIAKKSKGEQPDREKLYFVQADYMEKSNFLSDFKNKYLVKETGYVPDRVPKTSEEPVEELEIQEEEEPEYIELEPEEFNEEAPKKKKQGTVIEEPELNRDKKEHSIEEKKQLQQDQQRLKDLFK